MAMLIVEHGVDANTLNKPKFSLIISTTIGEIRASVITGPEGSMPLGLFGRPTSPVYNSLNGAAILVETLMLDSAKDTVLAIGILNTGTQPAVAKAELSLFSGNPLEHFVSVIDQAAINIAPGAVWSAHILLKMHS